MNSQEVSYMKHVVGGHILVIDSGVGGLGVLAQIQRLLPRTLYTYVADEAYFPYGKQDKQTLRVRCEAIIRAVQVLKQVPIDCVVIACNTASTVVLEHLRAEFKFPIVGIVPAIKVAAAASQTKVFGVLATEATANGVYIQTLIHEFARDCEVRLIGAKNLAKLAEQKMNGMDILAADVAKEIQPLFVGRSKIDQVVLGCTHFPFLLDELLEAAPYPVGWIDPAEAVAKRVLDVFLPSLKVNVESQVCHFTSFRKSMYHIENIEFKYLDNLSD